MSDCPGPGCSHPSHVNGKTARAFRADVHPAFPTVPTGNAPTTEADFHPPPSARPVPPWTDPAAFDGWEAEVGRMVDRAEHLDAQAAQAGGAIASAARKMAQRLRVKALLLSREAQAVTGRKAP